MAFNNILGQDLVIQLLRNSIKNNHLSHAYLFTGPKGVGKETTALAFAQSLNCLDFAHLGDSCNKCISCRKFNSNNQPDIQIIRPEGQSIKIDQIRQLKNKAFYKCYESKYKVIIFSDAHLMTGEGANSLLKILEEPPANTIFILITAEPQQLLETIISRCQQVYFNYLSEEQVATILREKYPQGGQAPVLAKLSRGSIGMALEMTEQQGVLGTRQEVLDLLQDIPNLNIDQLLGWAEKWERNKEGARLVLEVAQLWYRDHLVWKVTGQEELIINQDYLVQIKEGKYTLDKVITILELLHKSFAPLKFNVNPRLVLEVLLLKVK